MIMYIRCLMHTFYANLYILCTLRKLIYDKVCHKSLTFSTCDFKSDVLLRSKVREIGNFHHHGLSDPLSSHLIGRQISVIQS